MTLKIRRCIFYSLLVLFIVVGGSVASYADGWRLDFQTWHLEKVGGVYVRAFPEDASISLNGKPIQNQSGFLNSGTLISNLLPHTYHIALTSPGFDAWHENAAVLPSLVTQFKYAVLVPANGIPASSSVLAQLIATQPTSTLADPFDATQKLLLGKNKISIFNITQATTTLTIAVPGSTLSAQWITGNTIAILQNGGEFYIYTIDAQKLTPLASGVKAFALTDDGSLAAALEQNSLEIFALDSNGNTSDNDYRFNIPDIVDAEKIIWYKDQSHLFIVYPNSVLFLDLADTNLTNLITVAKGTSPYYDPQTNTLSITSAIGKLLQYNFPN